MFIEKLSMKAEFHWEHLDYSGAWGWIFASFSYRLCDPSEKSIYKSSPLFGIYYSVEKIGSLKVGDPVYQMVAWQNHQVKGSLCFWSAVPWSKGHIFWYGDVFLFCCYNSWENEQFLFLSVELENALYLFVLNKCSFKKYVFIWLYQILVAACRIFSCGMWELVPWPGIDVSWIWSSIVNTTEKLVKFPSSYHF